MRGLPTMWVPTHTQSDALSRQKMRGHPSKSATERDSFALKLDKVWQPPFFMIGDLLSQQGLHNFHSNQINSHL